MNSNNPKYKKLFLILSCGVALSMTACTTAQTKRGLTGAAIGGAAGVGLSAITGGDLATGAVIGAAGGGAIGAVTAPSEDGHRRHRRGYRY